MKFNANEFASFTTILHFIQEKYHLAVLTESSPLQDKTSEEIQKKLLEPRKFEDFLDIFAESFGYEVMRDSRNHRRHVTNLVVLRKVYNTIPDAPEVTEAELLASLREIRQMFVPYPHNSNPFLDTILDFYESLSSQQVSLAKQGKLPVKELTEKQRRVSEKIVTYLYTNNMSSDFPDQIDTLNFLIFEKNKLTARGKDNIVLTYNYGTGKHRGQNDIYGKYIDFEKNSESQKLTTLINSRKIPAKIQISKDLEDKRCIALGCENLPSGVLSRGLDWMFGVHLSYMTQDVTRITRRVPLKPTNVFELHKALYYSIPAPVVRACDVSAGSQKIAAEVARLDAKARQLQQNARDEKAYQEWQKILEKKQWVVSQSNRVALGMDKNLACADCFLTELRELFKYKNQVKYSELSEEGKRNFLVSASLKLYKNIAGNILGEDGPHYISEYENSYISAGPKKDKGEDLIAIGYVTPFGAGGIRATATETPAKRH